MVLRCLARHARQVGFLARLPIATTLRPGSRSGSLRDDVIAGVSVGAVVVPMSLAYGQLLGLAPVSGLYAALGGMVGFALLSRSRVVVGPEASLVAVSLGALAAGKQDPAAAAATLALLTGGFCCLLALLRLQFAASFLSRPILIGYLAGLAAVVAVGQLGDLLGVDAGSGETVPAVLDDLSGSLGDAHAPTVVLGLTVIAAMVALQRWLPRLPAALVVLAAAIAASVLLDLGARGIALTGPLPNGLPTPSLPGLSDLRFEVLVPAAAALALLGFADTLSTSRAFGARHGERVGAESEAAALGAANVASGLAGGFPVSASTVRTAVADANRARTQLTQLIGAVVVVLVLLLLTDVLADLPVAALAGVVVVALARLVDVRGLLALRQAFPVEAGLAVATFAAVTILGVLPGLAFAIVLSLLNLVHEIGRPMDPGVPVGEHPLEERWRPEAPSPDPRVRVVTLPPSIFFADAEPLEDRLRLLASLADPPRCLVLDASRSDYLDSTGFEALDRLRADLERAGIRTVIAGARGRVRETLERAGWSALSPTVDGACASAQDDLP